MDLKIHNLQQISQPERITQTPEADGSFRFTLLSNIEESELQAALSGMQILVTDCTPTARPLRSWDFTKPTAIILGNEHSGVAPELASIATGELYIPMYGMIQSFNVSVAAAIILAEASRQREAAGFYEQMRYTQEAYEARLADWLER